MRLILAAGSGSRLRFQLLFLIVVFWISGVCSASPLPGSPQRIVSTSPSITEALFALGLGPKVVGVSNYCEFPPEVLRLPKVGTYLDPDPELIARLQPDLVIVHKLSNELTNRLAALHIRYAQVDLGALEDTYSEILEIGQATGTEAQALAVVQGMHERMAQIRRRSRERPAVSVVLVIGRTPGTLSNLVVVGRDGFLNDLVETAGGRNLIAAESNAPYPHIGLETLLRVNPDVIVDLGDMGRSSEDRRKTVEGNLKLWREVRELKAVGKDRVYSVSSTAFVVPGPRAVEAAETLYQILEGLTAP